MTHNAKAKSQDTAPKASQNLATDLCDSPIYCYLPMDMYAYMYVYRQDTCTRICISLASESPSSFFLSVYRFHMLHLHPTRIAGTSLTRVVSCVHCIFLRGRPPSVSSCHETRRPLRGWTHDINSFSFTKLYAECKRLYRPPRS